MLKSGAERAVDQSKPVCLREQRFDVSARIGPEQGFGLGGAQRDEGAVPAGSIRCGAAVMSRGRGRSP